MLEQAISEAKEIAATAVRLKRVFPEGDRFIYGFDAVPNLYVVADKNVTAFGLALLLVEQLIIARASAHGAQAAARVQDLLSLLPVGGVQ